MPRAKARKAWYDVFYPPAQIQHLSEEGRRMSMHLPQLSYLGVIPRPEFSEYGFQITNENKSVRLLTLSIANSVFLTKQLMVQEAPDLCYQKVLADIRSDVPCLNEEFASVTESDIVQYRAAHPNAKLQRKSFRKLAE
jgi:hypothetical protein